MEEEKIVLDRKSFEALAVDTRVRILKALKVRRKTLSELSEELGLAVSGVKEHLETLEGAGLIKKMDDGHKWKYYELTKKGSEIIGPKELRVWILLSISAVALMLSMFTVLYTPASLPAESGGGTVEKAFASDNYSAEPGPMLAATAPPRNVPEAASHQPPALPLAIAAISAVTALACAGVLIRNRLGPA